MSREQFTVSRHLLRRTARRAERKLERDNVDYDFKVHYVPRGPFRWHVIGQRRES